MERLRKRLTWAVSLFLLILVLGCSLKIDVDPSKLGRSKPSQSDEGDG